jgi:hypothetical protein
MYATWACSVYYLLLCATSAGPYGKPLLFYTVSFVSPSHQFGYVMHCLLQRQFDRVFHLREVTTFLSQSESESLWNHCLLWSPSPSPSPPPSPSSLSPSLSSPTPFVFEGDELAPVATVCDVASDFDWRLGLPVLYASSICCFLIYVGAGAYYDSLATRAGHRSVLYILTVDFWRNACCMRPRSQAYMASVDRTVRSHACVVLCKVWRPVKALWWCGDVSLAECEGATAGETDELSRLPLIRVRDAVVH